MKNPKATREAYGETLASLKDKNVVVLDADLSHSTKTAYFTKKHPDRFFEMGIAEANMMGVAAGLSTCSKIPFVSTFAIFASCRALDQIRNSICYPNLNVKICATHAGLTVGEDGASHQALEDISTMRTLPNMRVLVPADADEAAEMVKFAAEDKGPMYIRLSRNKVPFISTKFRFGKAQIMRKGKDATIIACGYMVIKSLEAADLLKKKDIKVTVLNMSTIKPIDEKAIIDCPKPIVTVEEHQINGGLGSAVAEVLAEHKPARMMRVGVLDRFGQSGNPEGLLDAYGLSPRNIANTVEKLLK